MLPRYTNLFDLCFKCPKNGLEITTAIFWWDLQQNHHCLLRIYHHRQTIVVASELASSQGQSLTNCIDDIAPLVCNRFDLNLANTVWIEHIGPFSGLKEKEEFSRVDLCPSPNPSLQFQPETPPHAWDYPQWTQLNLEDVQELTQQRLIPVSFAIAELSAQTGVGLVELEIDFSKIEQTDHLVQPGDVFCQRIGSYWLTNVPHSPVHHSPSGFAWGYPGSGPAELALCILNLFLQTEGSDTVECYGGSCSHTAWALHQDFKDEFITTLPKAGGQSQLTLFVTGLASTTFLLKRKLLFQS